jgi:hypothetical protein
MSESFAMNAADLTGPSSLYPPVSSASLTTNSLSMNGNGSQPSKMIPVPGLPSHVSNSQHLQQARSNFSQNSPMARSQQQLQIPKSQGMYQALSSPNLSSQKLAGSLPVDQSQQQSSMQNMSLPMGRPMFDPQTTSSPMTMLQRQQPVAAVQQQQLNMQSQQQQQRQGTPQQQQQQQNTLANQQQVRQQVSQVIQNSPE